MDLIEDTKFDVEQQVIKTEEIIKEELPDKCASEENISEEENGLYHQFHSKFNGQSVATDNIQEERSVPVNIYIKEEHDCANQSQLDVASVVGDIKHEDGWRQENETTELSAQLDMKDFIKHEDGWCQENKTTKLTAEPEMKNLINNKWEMDNKHKLECETLNCDCEAIFEWENDPAQCDYGTFTCEFCEYTTKSEGILKYHVSVHHNDISAIFKCAWCKYRAKKKFSLIRHIEHNHSQQYEVFKCASCDYSAKWKTLLIRHIKVVHDANALRCESCNFSTQVKHRFKRHMELNHNEKRQILRCDECDYTTKVKANLRQHKKRNHLEKC